MNIFDNFKSRLILIFLLIGMACYFLIPTYNKYFTTSNYEIIFDSPDKTTSIPIGTGILLEVNKSANRACLSNFEFYSNDTVDSVEALLLDESSQSTVDWGELELSNPDQEILGVKCLDSIDVCIAIENSILYYHTSVKISKFKFSHDGCVDNTMGGAVQTYKFIPSIEEDLEQDGAIKLGLDLQGGMYIQLELDIAKLILNNAKIGKIRNLTLLTSERGIL